MVKLDRYIGTSVFFAILAVLGIIVVLALLFAYIDELGDISATYGLLDAGEQYFKETGKPLTFQIPTNDGEILITIVARLIRESQS